MCTALVVDDDGFFRKAISRLLREQFPTLEVKEAGDGQEALQKLDGVDLLFVDISLPAESGLDLTAKIKSAHPDLLVSILTLHDSLEYRQAAFQHGADYFVSKGSSAEQILKVVRSVVAN